MGIDIPDYVMTNDDSRWSAAGSRQTADMVSLIKRLKHTLTHSKNFKLIDCVISRLSLILVLAVDIMHMTQSQML